jgi:putative addiction module component (TIGR02574 family)
MSYKVNVVIERDEFGYYAHCPELEGCQTEGDSLEELWDSIAASQASVGITESQRKELDRRIEEYEIAPDVGSSWVDVMRKLKSHNFLPM